MDPYHTEIIYHDDQSYEIISYKNNVLSLKFKMVWENGTSYIKKSKTYETVDGVTMIKNKQENTYSEEMRHISERYSQCWNYEAGILVSYSYGIDGSDGFKKNGIHIEYLPNGCIYRISFFYRNECCISSEKRELVFEELREKALHPSRLEWFS
jgi:hypothetical protein